MGSRLAVQPDAVSERVLVRAVYVAPLMVPLNGSGLVSPASAACLVDGYCFTNNNVC
jgi:hypothetical protein